MSKVNNTVDLPYPDIYIKNNKVYQKVDREEIRVSDAMGISTIKTDIDSSKIESMIYYYECGIKKERSMDRNDYLNPTNLMSYQRFGLDVMRDNSYSLAKHFRNEEEIAKRVNIHKTLGFGIYNEKLIYKHHKCVGIDSTYEGGKRNKA